MKMDIGGEEKFDVPIEALWTALNDPAVLKACIPGCQDMIDEGNDHFRLMLNLKVAAVGGIVRGQDFARRTSSRRRNARSLCRAPARSVMAKARRPLR